LELEWDELDAQSRHVLAESGQGEPVGTGRLLPDGHIGRMAVLSDWRGCGVGSGLLQALLCLARAQGHAEVLLNAQTHAEPFYARHGFVSSGEPFTDAGIPHRTMRLVLKPHALVCR
jgi:predicted GNAT family N-acyltransferase